MTRDLYVRLSDFAAAIGVTKTEAARRMIEEGVGDEMRKRRVET